MVHLSKYFTHFFSKKKVFLETSLSMGLNSPYYRIIFYFPISYVYELSVDKSPFYLFNFATSMEINSGK